MRRWILGLLFALAALADVSPLFAQATGYPARPIRLIVPYSPGGVADLLSRIVAQRLGPIYKQQIIIDNRPG